MSHHDTLHIYTRVSTNAQEEKGTSLESQQQLGLKKAKDLGLGHKVWNEGGASSNYEDFKNRPVLLKLLDKINRGEVSHLWVYNNDRLSRNEITAQNIRIALQKYGVKLYTKDGVFDLNNPQDKLIKTILDGISQFDNTLRAERTRMGKLHRIKQGFWQGGPPPFGYKIHEKKLVIDPEESQWVKQIFQWYSDKVPINKIKDNLIQSGVKTRRGNYIWSLGSINKLLQNTHHKGQYTYNDSTTEEVVNCVCPAIVTDTLWNRCQENRLQLLERKGQNIKTKHFYMLRNLMYCGHCKSPLSGRIKKSKYEKHYYCPKKERDWKNSTYKDEEKWVRGKGCSMVRSLNIDAADKLVWDSVVEIIDKSFSKKYKSDRTLLVLVEEYVKNLQDSYELADNSTAIKKLFKEQKDIENNIISVETAKIRGNQDRRIADGIIKNLNQELSRVKENIEQLNFQDRSKAKFENIDKIIEGFTKDKEALNSYSKEEKKAYLSSVIERIDVFWDSKRKLHRLEIYFILKNFNNKIKSNFSMETSNIGIRLKKKTLKNEKKSNIKYPPTKQNRHGGVRFCYE